MPAPTPENDPDRLAASADDGLLHSSSTALQQDLLASQDARNLLHELDAELDPESADVLAKRKLGIPFWIATGWVVLLLLLALVAPAVAPEDGSGMLDSPNEQPRGANATAEMSLPPLSTRLDGTVAVLGTDKLGRDQLSRVMHGARVSLTVGFASIILGLAIGGAIGLSAGYFRGKIDNVFMAGMDTMLAFPALLLALSIVAIRGKGVANAVLAITIVSIPTIARLVRANTLVFAQREFVVAARTLGASHLRVMTREVLPNVALALLPFIPLGAAVAVAAEGALAYLGQSVEIPQASWGSMISEGRAELDAGHWWVPSVPIAFLVVTLIMLNLIGDRLREFFSLKEGTL